jgi:hypothetical protein
VGELPGYCKSVDNIFFQKLFSILIPLSVLGFFFYPLVGALIGWIVGKIKEKK